MAVSIKDIAREAGVSHSTVSRALRNDPLVAEATAARIHKLAAQLGYVPSAAARSLKTNQSRVLGVIVHRISDPYYSRVLEGIESEMQSEGYSLFLASTGYDTERERDIVTAMVERRVDGIIVCSTFITLDLRQQLGAYDAPVVAVHNLSTEDTTHAITHDNLYGGRAVTSYLIDLGHRRIAFLGNRNGGRVTHDRLIGYRQAHQEADIPVREEYIYHAANGRLSGGEEGAHYFLDQEEPPTAIACFNDMVAVGAMTTLQQAGIQVPADCSLVGFDNITLSGYVNPPLTTFDQPKYTVGQEAARMMLHLLHKKTEQDPDATSIDRLGLRGNMLIRQSTGPPRTKDA